MQATLERGNVINHQDRPTHRADAVFGSGIVRKPETNRVGPDAFRLENELTSTRRELKRNIVSYLGEYRLQVQKHSYDLVYGRDRNHRGEVSLRDQDYGESLALKAKRTLASRKSEGKPLLREIAEEEGIVSLNDQLRTAQTGDTVIWASPPGPKDQGYGDYGFLFTGEVKQVSHEQKHIAMTAIRIEKPKAIADADPWLHRFNEVVGSLTGEQNSRQTREDLLRSPVVINEKIDPRMIDAYIARSFSFAPDTKERLRTQTILAQMDPYIEEFITRMETGTPGDKLTAFHALENYALQLKKKSEQSAHSTLIFESPIRQSYDTILKAYGYEPPKVGGSCGSSDSSKSTHVGGLSRSTINAMLGLGYNEDELGSLTFECTEGHKNTREPHQKITTCSTKDCKGSVGC